MKTKFLISIGIMATGSVLYAMKFDVNTEMSSLEWEGKKIGGKHNGYIQLQRGDLKIENDQIVGGSFVVDMTSITNADIKDEGTNQKLVGHLKSDDFFGVESFPTASFEVVQATKFENGTATLTGDITIKGKTERISFEVSKMESEYTADVVIDRSKFDVRYGSKSFFNNLGDRAIDDLFTLRIKLVVG